MGHPQRDDEPGAWHHLMNRGVGRRTMFDNDEDARSFLALLAKLAHLGLLETVAFCLMPNHLHLLVRSPEGRLGDAMRYLEGVYNRGFNRRRGRDGALVRGRYRSKRVRSDAYRSAVLAYIDQNPVDAKLVADPRSYPFGSARHYARAFGPPWLSREWVEEHARRQSGGGVFDWDAYERVFGGAARLARARWLSSAMESRRPDDASLDELIAATPEHVQRWLEERAMLADGTARLLPVADAESVTAAVASAAMAAPGWSVTPRGRRRAAWTIVAAGLLRVLAGQTRRQIAIRLSVPETVARDLCTEHMGLVRKDPAYAAIAAGVTRVAIDRSHGRGRNPPKCV